MVVTTRDKQRVAVVMPKAITPISRPKRPLEP
jgi:hypothetical protein